MDLTGIRNIVFDFGGVLVNLNKQRVLDSLTSMGFRHIENYLTNFGHVDCFGAFENGDIDNATFFQQVRDLIASQHPGEDLELPTDSQLDAVWASFLEDIPLRKIRMVHALSKRYRICILSNTSEIHVRALRQFDEAGYPLDECVSGKYYSYRMKHSKPGREIFEMMLADSGMKPEETLFVDDSRRNCDTARSLGFRIYQPQTNSDFCDDLCPEIMKEIDAGGCVATMGFFDGVHRGHCYLLDSLKTIAAQRHRQSLVLSFWPHPSQVLHGRSPRLLTDAAEKQALLNATGVDRVEMLDFTPELAGMSAYDFMKKVLVERYGVKTLLIGYDHHFGSRQCGDTEGFEDYRRYGAELGVEVLRADAYHSALMPERTALNSSYIRKCLSDKQIEKANQALGYHYFLRGVVESGFENGHRLGFPTANIRLPEAGKLLPGDGVYAVEVKVLDTEALGMLNIGCRPTLDNGGKRTVEVNIFDFDQNIYGKEIEVRFLYYLRDEQRFESTEALARQLQLDRERILGQSAGN